MELYIGTKLVNAEPSPAWRDYADHKKGEDGYLIKYEDNYVSWSPKDVFEKAYHKIYGMTFGQAIEAVKAGQKAQRSGWNGKNQYIELAKNISYIGADGKIVNVNHTAMGNKAIAFVGTSGVQLGWLASQADILAEDWKLVVD